MNYLFHAYSTTTLISTTGCRFVSRRTTSFWGFSTPSSWTTTTTTRRTSFGHASFKFVNFDSSSYFYRFRVQCYSSRRSTGIRSRATQKSDPKADMEQEKSTFFVVRKGDIVGVYKNLSDCQAQVGSSICDPPVSVFKGNSMPKGAEEYLLSCGLKNALYSIRAADLTDEIFGTLVPCTFQQPSFSKVEPSREDLPKKRLQEMLGSETGEGLGSSSISNNLSRKQAKLDLHMEAQALSSGRSCILQFDGASKGNPGQAGAGAVLRSNDGTLICRLRQGLGIATNNVAEYRAMILGLRYALEKGFTNIHVMGDSNLVCMQIQGLWKVKNENISRLYEEAKKLKDKFLSFQINHVLRDFNSEADAQANLAVDLADGQVQEEVEK
ncbi:hypothetical protein LguiA_023824 [Lonicera macranthoides]